ncbi:MAG: glycogen debranching protein GlgX [Bowdeniella nasicola]|nr:glycogen debranching protein GlgX [Bowdeniella nasicola]
MNQAPVRHQPQRAQLPAADRGRLGVHPVPGGVDVAVYAPRATAVEVCFFRPTSTGEIEEPYLLRGPVHGVWHAHIPGITVGTVYGFRAHGRWDVASAQRFNPHRLLLDPYARAVTGSFELHDSLYDHQRTADGKPLRPLTPAYADPMDHSVRGVVVDPPFSAYDSRPRHRWRDTVIYEGHIRGLTMRHPGVPEHLRGTYAGAAHPAFIAHLQKLGVTALELLPIHLSAPEPFVAAKGLTNYWGYNTLGFFAPEPRYATEESRRRGPQAVVEEVTGMVELLHQAGIEVILDVVYNHTCEAGHEGMSLSLRGLDEAGYYLHRDDGTCVDYTGCGNTLDFRRTRVVQLALDSLRYWTREVGVDGFRFDLAVTLGRHGEHYTDHHPFLTALATDPILRDVKLISEPWDLGPNGWRTGQFPSPMADWNDRFRDAVRTFWLADAGRLARNQTPTSLADLGNRISGSADIFSHGEVPGGRGPLGSINFVTAHDGFTLADLVSYDHKHNEANREGNRDGTDRNLSWNHGAEGFVSEAGVAEAVIPARRRSMRNLLGTLLISAGVPMLTAGDESGRTQKGNNNAYCQDNELSWLHWDWADWQDDLAETVAYLLKLRRSYRALRPNRFASGRPAPGDILPDLAWFGTDALPRASAHWHDPHNRALQMLRSGFGREADALVVFNGCLEPVSVTLAAGRTLDDDDGATRAAAWRRVWDSVWERPRDSHKTIPAAATVSVEPLSMQIYVSDVTEGPHEHHRR